MEKLPALIKWENYIKQFPKLEEYWLMVPEPAKTLFQIQINVYGQHFWDIITEEEDRSKKLREKNKSIIELLQAKHDGFIGNRKDQITSANANGFKEGLGWAIDTIKTIITQKTEEQLYEEALRATCSLCVIEGRCVCGELDPLEEDEEDYTDREGDLDNECDGGHCEDECGRCMFCDKRL